MVQASGKGRAEALGAEPTSRSEKILKEAWIPSIYFKGAMCVFVKITHFTRTVKFSPLLSPRACTDI